MNDTDRLTLQRGADAKALLGVQEFVKVVTDLMNYHHDAIAQTQDDEARLREQHFRKMRAYQDLVAELQTRVAAGDALAKQLEEDAQGAPSIETEE